MASQSKAPEACTGHLRERELSVAANTGTLTCSFREREGERKVSCVLLAQVARAQFSLKFAV